MGCFGGSLANFDTSRTLFLTTVAQGLGSNGRQATPRYVSHILKCSGSLCPCPAFVFYHLPLVYHLCHTETLFIPAFLILFTAPQSFVGFVFLVSYPEEGNPRHF